jgi:DNA polymerase-1
VWLDIETNGEPVYDKSFEVRTVQVASPAWDSAYVIPARIEYYADIRRLLKAAPVIGGHNLTYEWQALAVADITDSPNEHWHKSIDTMLITALAAHPQAPKLLALKENVRALVDADYDLDKRLKEFMRFENQDLEWVDNVGNLPGFPPAVLVRKRRKEPYTWASVPIDSSEFLEYAAGDVIAPPHLFDVLSLSAYAALPALYKRERDLAVLMQGITVRGLPVNPDALDEAEEELRQQVAGPRNTLRAAGIDTETGLSAATRDILLAALDAAKIKPPKTPKGGISLAQNQMILAADGKPLPAVLEAWYALAQARKFQTTYLDHFRDGLDNDGTIHPDIRVMGAMTTARMSISDPPLQQLPTQGATRSCLTARPGKVLVGADLSQIEFRVAAAISGDVTLLQAFKDGVGVHDIVSARMYGPNYTEQQRSIAKRGGFGWLYGGGAKTLASQTGVSMKVAGGVMKALKESYPTLAAFKDQAAEMTRIVTSYGRELQPDAGRKYASLNYLVQSTARDIFTDGVFRAAKVFGPEAMWLPVHDELIIEVDAEDGDYAAHVLGEALSTTFMGVDCPALGKVIGSRWAK